MRGKAVALGILGLICAASLPASAQGKIKIFGQNYAVVSQTAVKVFGQNYFWTGFGPVTRAQTYKNGVTISLDDGASGVNNFASVSFAEGATIATDRLWFAARIAGGVGDQLYYLEGSDANGMFTPSVSNAKQLFGGKVDTTRGGRPVYVLEMNRDETGLKRDRNVLVLTFQNDDSVRLFDLDTMTDSHSDALFSRLKTSQAVSAGDGGIEADVNLPFASFACFALLPTSDGHTILASGGPGNANETALSIWDTKTNAAYPVLTDITAQTRSSSKPFPQTDSAGANLLNFGIARYGTAGEYWFLLNSNPGPGGSTHDTDPAGIVLVRATVTLPANPATAKPGDIKVTVLDTQDLKATASDILFPKGTQGITGITVGRPVTANGPRILYTTDYDGNFYTLIPVP